MAALTKMAAERRALRRTGDGGKRIEHLALSLAGEKYAVPIAHVGEILRLPPITEVPRAPRDVLGVISVRGRLVTVVDLRRRLGVQEAPFDGKTRILLSDVGLAESIGLIVDEVHQVWRFAADEIEAASVLGGEPPAHIAGLGRPAGGNGEVFVILNLRPILAAL